MLLFAAWLSAVGAVAPAASCCWALVAGDTCLAGLKVGTAFLAWWAEIVAALCWRAALPLVTRLLGVVSGACPAG